MERTLPVDGNNPQVQESPEHHPMFGQLLLTVRSSVEAQVLFH